MKISDFIKKADDFGSRRIPFIFVIDFELNRPVIHPLEKAIDYQIFYQIKERSNFTARNDLKNKPVLKLSPVSFDRYQQSFLAVMDHILAGNTYLINLTFPTSIQCNQSLLELFSVAKAPYKFYFKDQFIVFSPECFIKTRNNQIFSYPMKGTIDADVPDASRLILENRKEMWEHNTITDLIRNDLAMISECITVTKFRFISKIITNRKNLLQVSSEIQGKLSENWQQEIGTILVKLLPAGSISGAPKQKTIEIIQSVEKGVRGYFSGVFGIFDGRNIDSAVNIRFIEKSADGLQFRSGGGITANSNSRDEYNEMLDKVYVPVF